MQINPYQAPTSDSPVAQRAKTSSGVTIQDEQFLLYAQLLLRLLGLMLVVEGGSQLLFQVTFVVHSVYFTHSNEVLLLTSQVAGWWAQLIGKILVGGYLMLGGQWVLDKVILPLQFRKRLLAEPSPGDNDANA